jgi:hypothetical protein
VKNAQKFFVAAPKPGITSCQALLRSGKANEAVDCISIAIEWDVTINSVNTNRGANSARPPKIPERIPDPAQLTTERRFIHGGISRSELADSSGGNHTP